MREAEVIETTAVAVRERSKAEWQRNKRRSFVAENGFSMAANYATNGKRKAILERDGYRCVDCGMSDDEHKARWGRPITIDHVDKDRSNNSDANLQTRCLSCHGRKDLLPRLREQKVAQFKDAILAMRENGVTYQEIADATGFSIAIIHRWCIRWCQPRTRRSRYLREAI